MGCGAAGSREPGGGGRRGAGPGREALPARASRPRPRRPGRALPRRARRGRGGGGSDAGTPSRRAPRGRAPPPGPLPPPPTFPSAQAGSPGGPRPRPALQTPGPRSAVCGSRRPAPSRTLPRDVRGPRLPLFGAASASVACSSFSLLAVRPVSLGLVFCFPSFLSSPSPHPVSFSVPPCLCHPPTPLPVCVVSFSVSGSPSHFSRLILSRFSVPGSLSLTVAPSAPSPSNPVFLPTLGPPSPLFVCPSLPLCLPRPQPALSPSHTQSLILLLLQALSRI